MSTGPRTTPITVETASRRGTKTQRPVYVSGGAVHQDGSLKLYSCNTCHHEVVWAKSTKTGRHYLANVYRGASDTRYYVKASAHECQPTPDIASGPTEALLRGLKDQLAVIEPIVDQAYDDGDTALYERARAKKTELRRQIRDLDPEAL
jgi:hypothetical protein